MNKVIPEIQKTARLVQEIAATSNEQNSGSMQIAKAVDQFSQVTQQNSASSEELSSSAEELSSQAELLREIVSFFNTGKEIKARAIKTAHLDPKKNKSSLKTSGKKGLSLDINDRDFDGKNGSNYENF